ncbi:leucyl aminopeptidase family protein [Aestuariivirga sp.]|uniref:leucyl aminopeptidase family protein n=1 Tax=Aestuariivirga sp. TaxID=2650926 RepID=UPI003BAB13E8
MTDVETILLDPQRRGIPISAIASSAWEKTRKTMSADLRNWADANGFKGQPGRSLTVPGPGGALKQVLVGADQGGDAFALAKLCRNLPEGVYSLEAGFAAPDLLALGWCLEAYGFDRYGKTSAAVAKLVCPKGVDRKSILRAAKASYFVRDLVNMPASDMGPDELEAAAARMARVHKAKFSVTSGKALEKGFPMIHAVGRASPRLPRLIDFTWGPARAPKVTLVGKGVCFDTGGLDIKPAAGMALMKKDMGGAANVLGLAQMIMEAGLKLRLRVLVPAVENAISGNAFRPGDVLQSRKGITVEIGNTDAEGRLVLGDALALADEEAPDLLIDMATLTGAARVALGPDLPPFYTDDDRLAAAVADAGMRVNDPVWRLPLWRPYTRLFESSLADMNNAGDSGFAGSITAALFLRRFVEKAKSYAHFDVFAWTPSARPGRPKGGEAQAMRALFEVIRQRYG